MNTRIALALAGAALLAGCNNAPEVPIKDLMAKQVQPTAQTYWDAVRYESELVDGKVVNRDIRPRTDAEWEKVRKSAEDLIKFGELLQTDAYTEGRRPDWKEFAQGLVDSSRLAEQAAAAKDTDKVFEVAYTVYSVCDACHKAYPTESDANLTQD
jgi:hypothetical protein